MTKRLLQRRKHWTKLLERLSWRSKERLTRKMTHMLKMSGRKRSIMSKTTSKTIKVTRRLKIRKSSKPIGESCSISGGQWKLSFGSQVHGSSITTIKSSTTKSQRRHQQWMTDSSSQHSSYMTPTRALEISWRSPQSIVYYWRDLLYLLVIKLLRL